MPGRSMQRAFAVSRSSAWIIGSNGGSMVHELDLKTAKARCIDLPGTGELRLGDVDWRFCSRRDQRHALGGEPRLRPRGLRSTSRTRKVTRRVQDRAAACWKLGAAGTRVGALARRASGSRSRTGETVAVRRSRERQGGAARSGLRRSRSATPPDGERSGSSATATGAASVATEISRTTSTMSRFAFQTRSWRSAPLPRARISRTPSSSRSEPSSRACGSSSRSVRRTAAPPARGCAARSRGPSRAPRARSARRATCSRS